MEQEYTEEQMDKLQSNICTIIDRYAENKEEIPPRWAAYLHRGADGVERWVCVALQRGEVLTEGWIPFGIDPVEA